MNFKNIHVAYFSMEIGIDQNVPTYSGGLGILAGDTLRSCADLNLPVVGITLLYRKGYFRQRLDEDGSQHEEPVQWTPEHVLTKLPNTITLTIEGRTVHVGCWMYEQKGALGQVNPILFLDTNLPENAEYDRAITDILYGFDNKYRLAQEIVLGIGGVKMLHSLDAHIHKYHMNEGHSALLTLELYKELKSEHKARVEVVRGKCVFTTHTPVPAGHDQFPKELAKSMLGEYITPEMEQDAFEGEKLNMTYLGLRFSKFVNGVAKKHGEVSRSMFPGYHIESITNGVHSAFWTAEPMRKLFDKYIPQWQQDSFSLRYLLGIPKEEVWDAHMEAKKKLIEYVNAKCRVRMDEKVFTLGFARRATAYKRADMLFSDIRRLVKIAEANRIQIIYAGKAHPKDTEGKDIIRKIFSTMKELRPKIEMCFVEDYNIEVAKMLVSGVDVWLNTPLRPKEASGTSGMKAAHNGVPHFSILDGWWIEGHIENVTGWSIGNPRADMENNHDEDVEDMYNKLEYVILPTFYNQRDKWIEIMRHSIAINGSFFNTHRMVQQYVLNAYFS
ncbi:MAG: alpha-glucan family phosphorylase [archaeon]